LTKISELHSSEWENCSKLETDKSVAGSNDSLFSMYLSRISPVGVRQTRRGSGYCVLGHERYMGTFRHKKKAVDSFATLGNFPQKHKVPYLHECNCINLTQKISMFARNIYIWICQISSTFSYKNPVQFLTTCLHKIHFNIVRCRVVRVTTMTGSASDDWISTLVTSSFSHI
jgi:hypothetical protein